ncbi:hypothetical protein [Salininema proteolyticum]|uniref:Lipoprotein n=1 Tax=Salininema proteolyticum TaxID=1607685 RepID=A0ABV8TVB1_9ACTN
MVRRLAATALGLALLAGCQSPGGDAADDSGTGEATDAQANGTGAEVAEIDPEDRPTGPPVDQLLTAYEGRWEERPEGVDEPRFFEFDDQGTGTYTTAGAGHVYRGQIEPVGYGMDHYKGVAMNDPDDKVSLSIGWRDEDQEVLLLEGGEGTYYEFHRA